MQMRLSPQPVQLRTILWILVVGAVIRLWVMPLWNSFWLDEALTVWAIRDGFWQIFHAIPSTVGSVAFCAVEWLVGRLPGFFDADPPLPFPPASVSALYV